MHKQSTAISIVVSFLECNLFATSYKKLFLEKLYSKRGVAEIPFVGNQSDYLMQINRQWSEKRKDEIELELSLSYPEIGLWD